MPCAGRTGRVICRVSPEEQSGFIAKDNSGKANMYPVMVGSNKGVTALVSRRRLRGSFSSKGMSVLEFKILKGRTCRGIQMHKYGFQRRCSHSSSPPPTCHSPRRTRQAALRTARRRPPAASPSRPARDWSRSGPWLSVWVSYQVNSMGPLGA